MIPTIIGMIVFATTFGGVLLGMWLRTILPEYHLGNESKDTVKLGIGLIATMTALVLGLVTASSKSSFDTMDTAVKSTAMEILTLDRLLARYGPETREIRGALQHAVALRIDMIWPQGSSQPAQLDSFSVASKVEGLANGIGALKPRDDSQRYLQSRALELGEALLQTRWIASASVGTSVPLPFLVILLFWLTITFTSFGLFAPRNAMVIVVLFVCALSVCALSVGSSIFLILEMDSPFHGVLKVLAEPLRYALAHLNQ